MKQTTLATTQREKTIALNAEVTTAILLAERADQAALHAWRRVLAAETALATTLPDGLERDIANRGVGLAEAWIKVLENR